MGMRRRDVLLAFSFMILFGSGLIAVNHWRKAKTLIANTEPTISLFRMAEMNAKANPHVPDDDDDHLAKVAAETAKPAPSVAPTAALTPAQIEEALNSDNICLLFRHASEKAAIAQVLVERISSGSIRSLFSEQGPMSGNAATDGSDILFFYNALLYANLLVGVSVPRPDYLYSSQVFESLYSHDPQNGAYAFYKAEALGLLSASADEQKQWVMVALQAPYFHSFLKPIAEEMQQNLIQNTATWYEVTHFLTEIPIPRPPYALIKKLFPQPTVEEAQLIVKFGLQLNQDQQSTQIEYVMAKRLVESNWEKSGNTGAIPELRGLAPDPSQQKFDQSADIESELSQAECNRAPLDEAFQKAKEIGFHWQ